MPKETSLDATQDSALSKPMTDAASSPGGTEVDLEAIKKRESKATEGPWAWESVAEKSNDWVVGIACAESGAAILGHIDPPDDCAMVDTIIRHQEIGANESAAASLSDADFIAHARTDIPALVAALEASEAEVSRLRALVASSSVPQGEMGWRDMASAPKDRTEILVWENHEDGPRRRIVIYPSHHWGWLSVPGRIKVRPQGWMPLPIPPASLAGGDAQKDEK